MTLVLTISGVVLLVLGPGMFAWRLIGAWRGVNSGNLEYGVAPAVAIIFGLVATEKVAGWPGWLYGIMFVALPVALCAAIIWASKRGRAGR